MTTIKTFLEEYIEYASELTDAPIFFHNFVALSLLSTVISNKIFFMFGDQKIYPNLWIILIAPSSHFRKTTCINIGKRLLNPTLILPSEFSHEAIVELLEYKPTGCFFFSEFMSLMGLLQRDYMAGVKAFLADIYDSPELYRRTLKRKDIEIKNVCINFLSATTKEWFTKSLKESDLMAGFMPRFLLVPALIKERDMSIPPAVDIERKDKLYHRLQVFENGVVTGQMLLSDEAKQRYHEFYIKYKKFQHPLLDAFFRRFEIYCIKFAMLYEKNKDKKSNIISQESMTEAINNINWISKQLINLCENELTFTKFQENSQKVIKYLKSKNNIVSRVDLLNNIRLSTKELDEVLNTLLQSEKIRLIEERGEGTRKKRIYEMLS